MKQKNPCHECDQRTETCHIDCKLYKNWKAELDETNKWLRDQKPITSERLKKHEAEKIRKKARGWKRGGSTNER